MDAIDTDRSGTIEVQEFVSFLKNVESRLAKKPKAVVGFEVEKQCPDVLDIIVNDVSSSMDIISFICDSIADRALDFMNPEDTSNSFAFSSDLDVQT